MRPNRIVPSAIAAFVIAFFTSLPARADFVTFTASDSSGHSASVTFEVSGGNLIVTLTNTSSEDAWAPIDILTGVWFSLPGSLTPVSAEVADGSMVINPTDAGNAAFPDVSGEWAYASGLNMAWGSNSGIMSSGMDDTFGPGDLFSDNDLDPPDSPDGVNYGITSEGDDPDSANGGLADEPLIQNSVVFILSGWDSDWSLSDITNVVFQYGTSLDEGQLYIPEPGVWALLSVGLVGLIFAVRKMSWA